VVKSVVIPSDLLFDYGKAKLSPAASATLKTVADQLRTQNISQLTISGHTDSRGSARFNQRLSERRASAVYAWLTTAGCLEPAGIVARGYGASQPVAPNVSADGSDYSEGRARNRRVELRYTLVPGAAQPAPAKACPPD
jgi:OOP family OmpA-OmpF porin